MYYGLDRESTVKTIFSNKKIVFPLLKTYLCGIVV